MGMLIPIMLIQVLVISLFGAVFLRLGCWAFNKMSGRQSVSRNSITSKSKQPMPEIQNVSPISKDDKNPFAAPTSYAMEGAVVVDESKGVPTPSFIKALAIMFVYSLTGFVIGFCLSYVISWITPTNARSVGATVAAFNFASVFINFCLLAVIIRFALPTTAGKSAIVTVLTVVFAIVVALIIFVPIAWFSMRIQVQ